MSAQTSAPVQAAAPPVPPAAAALTPGDPLAALPPGAQGPVAAIRSRGVALRTALAGTYVSKMQGLIAADGTPAPSLPALTPPDAEDTATVAGLAASLRAPVAGLRAAVRQALAILGGPVPATSEFSAELGREFDTAISMARARAAATDPAAMAAVNATVPAPGTSASTPLDDVAALVIAAALDAYLPDLRAAAAQSGTHSSATPVGCDLLDQTPLLCVGSATNHLYSADEAMLIDLGGDSTFTNSAGGAPILDTATNTYLPVSTNIVLGGHNTYVAPFHVDPVSHVTFTSSQGAALASGVGMLVDQSSSATFTVPAPPNVAKQFIVAQGAGFSGLGTVFHQGGPVSYSVQANGLQSAVFAQGAFYLCGTHTQGGPVGAGGGCGPSGIVDQGGTDDQYRIDVGPIPKGGVATVWGQASGNRGNPTLSDDGGNDRFSVHVTSSATPPYSASDPTQAQPVIEAYVQGAGFGTQASLLEGLGNKVYSTALDAAGQAATRLFAQAGGDGVVFDDLGGNSTLTARTTLVDDRTITVADPCTCTSAHGAVTPPFNADQWLVAQGVGFTGVALLTERSGSQLYSAAADSNLRVHLDDQLSAPQSAAQLNVRGYNNPVTYGQGAAAGGGRGVLENLAGGNSFLLRSASSTDASAASAHTAAQPVVLAVAPGKAPLIGQGATDGSTAVPQVYTGAVIDQGSGVDTFTAESPNIATASPNPNGAFSAGRFWPRVQGYGLGGVFVAAGTAPVIASHPSTATCGSPGFRGFGAWASCPVGTSDPEHLPSDDGWNRGLTGPDEGATGSAPNASGALPGLAFTTDTPSAVPVTYDPPSVGSPRVTVGATLLNPAGAPIVGATVHFDFDGGVAGVTGTSTDWWNLWESDGVTDQSGTAHASLPLALGEKSFNFSAAFKPFAFRMLATYDGVGSNLYPRHVVLALTTTRCSGDLCPLPAVVPETPWAPLLVVLAALPVAASAVARRRRLMVAPPSRA